MTRGNMSKQRDHLLLHAHAWQPVGGGPLVRLGLATRGSGQLTPRDIEHALSRGINFLNWCGVADALSETIAALGRRRRDVVLCVQFEARTGADAAIELERLLHDLRTDYI